MSLVNGVVKAVYDPNWSNILNVNAVIEVVGDIIDIIDPLIADVFGPQTGSQPTGGPGSQVGSNNGNTANQNSNTNNTSGSNAGNTLGTPNTNTVGNPNNNPNTGNTSTPANNSGSTNNSNITGNNVTGNNYFIEHRAQKYFNGGKIKIPYKRTMLETFEMKTVSDTTKVNFSIHEHGKQEMWRGYTSNSRKSTIPIEDITVSNNLRVQDLVAEAYKINGKPKVRVEIEKVVKSFTFTKLETIDLSNKERIAAAGQILYYINKPAVTDQKNTEFKIAINPNITINEIPPENIKWKLNDIDFKSNDGVLKFAKDVNEKKDVKVTGVTGYPNSSIKSVNVQWVDGYKIEAEVVPAGTKNALKILSDYVNRIGTVFHKLDPSGKLEFKISYTGDEYLEEDSSSRFYNTIREGGVSGQIGFSFKGLKYGLPLRFVDAYIYLKPIISISVNGKMKYVKRNDMTNFTKSSYNLGLVPKFDLEAGGTIGIDTGSILTINAEPFAGLSSWGEIKYDSSENSINVTTGIGKPFVGIRGNITVGGYSIVPAGEIKKVFEEIKIESLPFKIKLN